MKVLLGLAVLMGALGAQQQAPALATSPKTAAVAAQDYYAACMDTAAIARLGTQPLGPMLQAIAAVANPYQLAAPVAALHRVGAGVLFQFGGMAPAPAPANDASDLQHMTTLFRLLGDSPAAAHTEALAALQVGQSLVRARQGPWQSVDRAQLARLAPNFNWTAYFSALGPAPATVRARPAQLQALNGRLLTFPLSAWQSELRWQWLALTAPMLPPAFERERAALLGAPPAPPRPQWCHAAVHAYTGAELLAARIRRDDYLGDTLRLRAARWAPHSP